MSLRIRALVFSTFFGSCLAIGLLLVSLTTNQWVRADAKRKNSTESRGEVNYGLFHGNKDLDLGFGVRSHAIEMTAFMRDEPHIMNYWLWLMTALGTGFALLSCAIAAIAAVIKAASASKKTGTMVLLLMANISAAFAQVIAFGCWLVQFYQYLIHNVLSLDDHKNQWYSHGLANLGYSFYLVIASTIVVLFNIGVLIYAKRCDRRERRRLEPPSEEKNQSAIMLY